VGTEPVIQRPSAGRIGDLSIGAAGTSPFELLPGSKQELAAWGAVSALFFLVSGGTKTGTDSRPKACQDFVGGTSHGEGPARPARRQMRKKLALVSIFRRGHTVLVNNFHHRTGPFLLRTAVFPEARTTEICFPFYVDLFSENWIKTLYIGSNPSYSCRSHKLKTPLNLAIVRDKEVNCTSVKPV
jgi:hypothetical protein